MRETLEILQILLYSSLSRDKLQFVSWLFTLYSRKKPEGGQLITQLESKRNVSGVIVCKIGGKLEQCNGQCQNLALKNTASRGALPELNSRVGKMEDAVNLTPWMLLGMLVTTRRCNFCTLTSQTAQLSLEPWLQAPQ